MYPRQRTDVLTRQVGGELIVLDQVANRVHQLNAVAALVWELCDGNNGMPAMVERVVERYDVSRASAESDVQSLLDHFLGLGLLETDGQSSK